MTNLEQDLEYVLQHVNPDVIVAPYPLLDEHPDHKICTVALIAALKDLHWMRGSLLLYTNHIPSSPIYPYGEAGDMVSLPPGINDIAFDGIVSNALTPAEQARKYLALDAMVDLRPGIRAESPASTGRAFAHSIKQAILANDDSYFRRAVRANELFFEVRVPSLYEPGITQRIEGDAVTRH